MAENNEMKLLETSDDDAGYNAVDGDVFGEYDPRSSTLFLVFHVFHKLSLGSEHHV